MFKIKGNYPYPILLEDKVDYKNSTIKARYLYQGLKNGHNIKIECDVQNEGIKKLISEKKACYAVQIESPNAMYRKMFEFYDNEDINITIGNDEVIDYIDIGIAILVKEEIENFYNEDFVDAYKDIKMKINKNEILGVCQNVRKFIILEDEVLKEVHSIFNLQKDENIKNILYDPNYDRILIRVPEDVGNYYLNSKEDKEKLKILNSILFTPILTSIVNDMNDAEDEFADKLWFKTLTNKFKEIMKEEKLTKEELKNDPYMTAQLLLKNISVESIRDLKSILERQEGDDE